MSIRGCALQQVPLCWQDAHRAAHHCMLLMMSGKLVFMADTGSSHPTLNTLTACTTSMPIMPVMRQVFMIHPAWRGICCIYWIT